MDAKPTARQMAKGLLNGILPPRPLLLPLVFSLGAKVENVSLSAFLTNPTKIASALRQMRMHLQTDGVTCHLGSDLAVETLAVTGGRGQRGPAAAYQSTSPEAAEIPGWLRSPEEAMQNSTVPVGVEVLRRMNALPNRDFLLVVVVRGPRSLAFRATGRESKSERLPAEALEFAGNILTQTVTALLEAGAEVTVIQEQVAPDLSTGALEEWAGLLAPAINVTRFYEALPVLQIEEGPAVEESWEALSRRKWECVLCAPASVGLSCRLQNASATHAPPFGIALPPEIFAPDETRSQGLLAEFHAAIQRLQPALITTAADVPVTTDMKYLRKVFSEITR
jgi:hypothetical protein